MIMTWPLPKFNLQFWLRNAEIVHNLAGETLEYVVDSLGSHYFLAEYFIQFICL